MLVAGVAAGIAACQIFSLIFTCCLISGIQKSAYGESSFAENSHCRIARAALRFVLAACAPQADHVRVFVLASALALCSLSVTRVDLLPLRGRRLYDNERRRKKTRPPFAFRYAVCRQFRPAETARKLLHFYCCF